MGLVITPGASPLGAISDHCLLVLAGFVEIPTLERQHHAPALQTVLSQGDSAGATQTIPLKDTASEFTKPAVPACMS
jgi:hypothetical protein